MNIIDVVVVDSPLLWSAEGRGSGGGRGTGGTLKKGRDERKSATGPGLSQRSGNIIDKHDY